MSLIFWLAVTRESLMTRLPQKENLSHLKDSEVSSLGYRRKILFKVKALRAGTTIVTANYNGQTARTNVTVMDVSEIGNVNANVSPSIECRSGVVVAGGCTIEVYGIASTKVLEESIPVTSVTSLAAFMWFVRQTSPAADRHSKSRVRIGMFVKTS